jgi:predicted nucleic acid-binding protein
MIVVDCSYALAMVMPDAMRPASLAQVAASRLLVPATWPFEVANAFRSAVRRARFTNEEMLTLCGRLEALQFELVSVHDAAVRQHCLASLSYGLTAYGAAYLELALQRRSPLATLDAALASAAAQAGVQVIH